MKTVIPSALLACACVLQTVLGQTPSSFDPTTDNVIVVKFDNVTPSLGGAVPLENTTVSPAISIPESTNASLLVLMVDLDAPYGSANHSFSPFLHWLQPSVPAGSATIERNYTSDVPAIAPYIGPAPPPGSGPHHYVVLAFEQPNATFTMPSGFSQYNATYRFVFDVKTFAQEASLGAPVGATWFTVENTTVTPKPYQGDGARAMPVQYLLQMVVVAMIMVLVKVV